MMWAPALGYVVAGVLLLAAVAKRTDRRVLEGLGEARTVDRPAGPGQSSRVWILVGSVVGGSVVAVDVPTALVAGPTLALMGWRLPAFMAARARRAYRDRMASSAPDVLDVVAVAVTAGLSPRLALDRATDAVGEPMGEELRAIRRDVVLGTSWRMGLRQVAERLGVSELRRLAIVIEQGQRLGAPIAGRLRALARDVRVERRSHREERARRAPVAMLFPLVFLILPAFILAAVVPAMLVALRGVT
jgi:tight adherence protein C